MRQILIAASVLALAALTTACGSNDCEAAADSIAAKYDSCGLEPPPSGTAEDAEEPECSEQLASQKTCQAKCVTDAECDVIDGTDGQGAFLIIKCQGAC